jgi:anion-transporting  ArsA/GET3 family ATPase
MTEAIAELLASKRVVVVCGAGGVGKTTTSASLALAAARAGQHVLVITIDPSKRLAQTLGVSANEPVPRQLPVERQRAVGIGEAGSLSAWMLDPQAVSDQTVRRISKDSTATDLLLRNRIYRHITSVISGMQEYTAVEALHRFVESDDYDLIVLDTPPSRDALRFLDAPSRAISFLNPRVFRLFVPRAENPIRRAAARGVERLLDLAFGAEARAELQQFFALFEGVLQFLNRNQHEMKQFLGSDDVSFVLVSSPAKEALEEAHYFEQKARDLSLPLAGYLLNRSLASSDTRPMPSADLVKGRASALQKRALEKLTTLAGDEAALVGEHTALLADLQARAQEGFALSLPELPAGASDLEDLVALADQLAP